MSLDISLNSQVRIAPGFRFQWEPVQNGYVLLFPEGMVQLNETAAAILEVFSQGKRSVESAVQQLQESFGEADLADDVISFLIEAREQGWVKIE